MSKRESRPQRPPQPQRPQPQRPTTDRQQLQDHEERAYKPEQGRQADPSGEPPPTPAPTKKRIIIS